MTLLSRSAFQLLTPPVPCSSYILCAICLLHLVCYPFEASHFLGCSRLWVTLLQGSGLLLLSLLPRDPFWRLCVWGEVPRPPVCDHGFRPRMAAAPTPALRDGLLDAGARLACSPLAGE